MDNTSDFLIYDVHHAKPGEVADDASQDHVWDKPWTTEQMREHSNNWSLGGDSGLLNRLREIAQTLTSKTHLIQKEVNSLSHEVEITNAVLNNVNNDFLMLSNTQFVESRVYDEEVSSSDISSDLEKKEVSKSKIEREAEVIAKVSCALKLGISVIEKAYEHLNVKDSDSEDEGESYQHEPILHPKDPYSNRPLPYIIGSELFYNNHKLGIAESLSEDELPDDMSSVSSKVSDEENGTSLLKNEKNGMLQDIDSDNGIHQAGPHEENHDTDIFNSEEKDDDRDSVDDFFKPEVKTKFDEELTSKLKIVSIESSERPDSKLKTLADASTVNHESDEDDLFGENGLFASKKKQTNENILKFENSIERTPEANDDFMQNQEIKSEVKAKERSSYQDSLFDDSDDDTNDLFATSTAKKSILTKSVLKEKDVHSEEIPTKKKLPFGAQSNFESRKWTQQVSKHGDNENEGSEYGGSGVSRSTSSASIRDSVKKDFSAISASSSGTLFVDDDDIDDLFGSSTTNHKPKDRPTDSLFSDLLDDDLEDMFAPTSTSKYSTFGSSAANSSNQQDKKSLSKSEVSSTNDEENFDDLFTQPTSSKQSSNLLSDTKSQQSNSNFSKASGETTKDLIQSDKSLTSKSLFDEDDDDFGNDLFANDLSKTWKPTDQGFLSKERDSSRKLFAGDDDDDDLFSSSAFGSANVNLFPSGNKDSTKMKDEMKKPISLKDSGGDSTSTAPEEVKLAVKLEEPEADGVFVVSAETIPSSAGRKTSSGEKISKLRLELENQLGDKLGLGASPEASRKKLVGGVSMLRPGMVPNLLKSQTTSSVPARENPETANVISEDNLPKIQIAVDSSANEGSSVKEESISFDDPAETTLLHNANKDRAKIQVKRRPQTRKARHETIRNSAIVVHSDILENIPAAAETQASSFSAPATPVNVDSTAEETRTSTSGVAMLSPSTDEDDLFVVGSRQPTTPQPLDKGLKTFQKPFSTAKQRSSTDNLFGDSSDDGDGEELFKPMSKSTKPKEDAGEIVQGNMTTDEGFKFQSAFKRGITGAPSQVSNKNDIFGDSPKQTQKTPQESKSKPSAEFKNESSKSLFGDDDDDDDLFTSSGKTPIGKLVKPAKNVLSAEPKRSLFDDKDDDDLFDDPLKAKSSNLKH